MAELYPLGVQRIFYRASNDSDLIVKAKLYDPNFVIDEEVYFSKLEGSRRIYYGDVNFYVEGIWLAIFYENDVEVTTQVYNTKKISAAGDFTFLGGKGPNVIGG